MSYPRREAILPQTFVSMTALDSVRAACRRFPNKAAIIHGDAERSYGDLVARSEALRNAAISDLGLKPGENAAIVARNCLEYMEVVLGLPDAGVAVATVNPRLSGGEIRAVVEDAEAKLVIIDAATAPALRASGLSDDIKIIELGAEYETLLANAVEPAEFPLINEWDVWTIPYTSGTTGRPKGVLISHRSRLMFGLVCASEFGCFGPDDKFLAMTPMAFGGGLGFPIASLSTGGCIEILDKFEPLVTLQKLKYGGVTGIFMVPTHFQMIFDLPEEVRAEYASPPLRAIISNAAPLPQAMKERIIPYFGEGLLNEIYSSTEMGVVCNLRSQFQLTKLQCVGTPEAHARVEVRRADGSICDVEEVGEMWVTSPTLFNGYWKRPEETAAAFRDGWVSVGDMGKRDEDGFLYIVDRKKDMVISGGVNIYPREVEELLLRHPLISEIAVIGVPDERWGERLKAFAVLEEGEELTLEGLNAFCQGQLANYKIPTELICVDSLPRNANGKVLKTELRLL